MSQPGAPDDPEEFADWARERGLCMWCGDPDADEDTHECGDCAWSRHEALDVMGTSWHGVDPR